jgi:hypothetical protein
MAVYALSTRVDRFRPKAAGGERPLWAVWRPQHGISAQSLGVTSVRGRALARAPARIHNQSLRIFEFRVRGSHLKARAFFGELNFRNVSHAREFYVAVVCAVAQEIVDHLEAALASFRGVAVGLPRLEGRG